jgi:hypothetical protein
MGNLLASAISLVWSPVEGFFDSFGMSQSPMARGAFASLTGYVFQAVLKPGISYYKDGDYYAPRKFAALADPGVDEGDYHKYYTLWPWWAWPTTFAIMASMFV